MVIGLNGSFQYFNRATTDIPDKTKEELSNRKLSELFFDSVYPNAARRLPPL